uniref:Reverse transcriptase domain-containing protein n=1 Tax=Haemonchus placei TaxID=6290 RepID=A0A0N4X4G8_HAEPC
MEASVCHSYTQGERCQEVSEFRPISILPTPIKVLEKFIKEHLLSWLTARNFVPLEQRGFVPEASTCAQLIDCAYDWISALNSKHNVDVIYYDITKAFDTVCHSSLLRKLDSDASKAVLQLDTNIDILKVSEDHPHVIHLRIETLEAQLEKLRLQFYLARASGDSTPYEGLVARGRLTPETWNLFLKEKHVDNHNQPLVLDPNQQGQLITNNLEFLGNYSTQLAGIRQTMADENRAQYYDDVRRSQEAGIAEGTTFEREVLAALNAIYHKLQTKEHHTRGRNARQLAETTTETSGKTKDTDVIPVKTNTDVNIQEAEKITIHKNVEFMEVINIDDEELETRQANLQFDEGLVVLHEVESDEDDKRIVVVVEKTPENTDTEASRNVSHRRVDILRSRQPATGKDSQEDRVADLELDLEETRELKARAEQQVNQLRRNKPRAWRMFLSARPTQQNLPCAFCLAVGSHYSDSCSEYRDVRTRRRLIRTDSRCNICLLPLDHHKGRCPRGGQQCRHCGERSHHTALCEEPQRAEQIAKDIKELVRKVKEYELTIEHKNAAGNKKVTGQTQVTFFSATPYK